LVLNNSPRAIASTLSFFSLDFAMSCSLEHSFDKGSEGGGATRRDLTNINNQRVSVKKESNSVNPVGLSDWFAKCRAVFDVMYLQSGGLGVFGVGSSSSLGGV